MKVSIIVIGDELLIGQVTDTNSGWIARYISPYGWEVNDVQTVSDKADDIRRAIDRAFACSDVVLTTGGLGPTRDDITKTVLRDYFGGEMITDPSVTENIHRIFGRRGLKMNPLTEAQAIVPSSCRVIQNRVGTAPVMWFERDGKVLVSMPGVPFETSTVMAEEVFPALLERFPSQVNIEHRVLMVTDYTESALAMKIAPWEDALPEYLHLAYLPKPGLIRLRLDGHHPDRDFIVKEIDRETSRLKEILGPAVLADRDLTPAEIVLDECRRRGLTMATAESCTGGNIAHELTLIAGASDVVNGGVVSYSNEVKINVLGVDAADIEAHGAVSIPVVRQMAAGVCRVTGSDVSVATSGIAGPGGGTEEKPVGTVCICARCGDREVYETARFNGSRERIINSATSRALILAAKLVTGKL